MAIEVEPALVRKRNILPPARGDLRVLGGKMADDHWSESLLRGRL